MMPSRLKTGFSVWMRLVLGVWVGLIKLSFILFINNIKNSITFADISMFPSRQLKIEKLRNIRQSSKSTNSWSYGTFWPCFEIIKLDHFFIKKHLIHSSFSDNNLQNGSNSLILDGITCLFISIWIFLIILLST